MVSFYLYRPEVSMVLFRRIKGLFFYKIEITLQNISEINCAFPDDVSSSSARYGLKLQLSLCKKIQIIPQIEDQYRLRFFS